MIVHLIIRGYLGKVLQFAQPWEIPEQNLDMVIPTLGKRHATAMEEGRLDMIEIEFLDEPDVNQRFHRIGTNPSGMRWPIARDLRNV